MVLRVRSSRRWEWLLFSDTTALHHYCGGARTRLIVFAMCRMTDEERVPLATAGFLLAVCVLGIQYDDRRELGG